MFQDMNTNSFSVTAFLKQGLSVQQFSEYYLKYFIEKCCAVGLQIDSSQIQLDCTKVRLCSEGVTKLFSKDFDRQNNIFLHPHGKRKPAPELHLIALNFESSKAIFLYFFSDYWPV